MMRLSIRIDAQECALSKISRAEFALESTMLRIRSSELTTDQVHDHLLAVADELGKLPEAVQGGRGLRFVWHRGRRLVVVVVDWLSNRPTRFWLSMDSLDWDAWEWWDLHMGGYEDVSGPYHLWTLPIANPQFGHGGYRMETWEQVFDVFRRLDDLPRELELIPPEWRSSWWSACPGGFNIHIDGSQPTTVSVAYLPGSVDLIIGGDDYVNIPSAALGPAPDSSTYRPCWPNWSTTEASAISAS